MPIDEVLARHRTARLFNHEWRGGVQLSVLVPTPGELRRWVGDKPFAEAEHDIVLAALQGWTGVIERHLDPQASGEAVPFGKPAADVLLSEYPELLDEVFRALVERYEARQKALEAARGNS